MSEREIPDSLKNLQDEKRSQPLSKIQEVIYELKNDSAEVTKNEEASVRYEKSLEKANGEISRLKAIIVTKDIKINEMELSQKELQEKYEILLGQLH